MLLFSLSDFTIISGYDLVSSSNTENFYIQKINGFMFGIELIDTKKTLFRMLSKTLVDVCKL